MFKKPDEWVVPLKDKTIKEIQDKEVVFTATFSRPDEKAKWAYKGDEIFTGKQYKIELLEDESKDKTIHQLTIKKPRFKNQGKYTVTCNEVQTGAYLDVEGKIECSVMLSNLVQSLYLSTKDLERLFFAFSHVMYLLCIIISTLFISANIYPEE